MKKIIRIVQKAWKNHTMPEKNFMLEMMAGMLATSKTNLTRIAAVLKEGITVKNTLKRLRRMLAHERILNVAIVMFLTMGWVKTTIELKRLI